MLKTDRLILRRWEESDAEDLFFFAKDPAIGPVAGWPAHQSAEESREVIRQVLSGKESYAVCLKEDGKAIGAIELKLPPRTELTDLADECELGYWIGKPFWGQGLIPEAGKEVLRHAFEDLGMQKVWCGYYAGNARSARVQQKLGFCNYRKIDRVPVPLLGETRTEYVGYLEKARWQQL